MAYLKTLPNWSYLDIDVIFYDKDKQPFLQMAHTVNVLRYKRRISPLKYAKKCIEWTSSALFEMNLRLMTENLFLRYDIKYILISTNLEMLVINENGTKILHGEDPMAFPRKRTDNRPMFYW